MLQKYHLKNYVAGHYKNYYLCLMEKSLNICNHFGITLVHCSNNIGLLLVEVNFHMTSKKCVECY